MFCQRFGLESEQHTIVESSSVFGFPLTFTVSHLEFWRATSLVIEYIAPVRAKRVLNTVCTFNRPIRGVEKAKHGDKFELEQV